MTKHPFILALMATALAACSAAASAQPEINPAPETASYAEPAPIEMTQYASNEYASAVTCDVRARRTDAGTLIIQARAFADRDLNGEYDLAITKSGGGNSSEINQSGALTLSAGYAATLGENEISVERGSRVRATLTLYDETGQICRRSFDL